MSQAVALHAVKAIHAFARAVFAGCILAFPMLAWRGRFSEASMLIAIVCAEILVLAANHMRCPLTAGAARYTADRADNFDIYLPLWLARYNKQVFGALFVAVLAAPTVTAGAEQKGAELAPVSLSLHIASDGAPSDVACGPTVVPALCPVLTKAVSRWAFAPGQRDSAPAAVDIWLGLTLVAVQKPQGFAIQATSAYVAPRRADAAPEGIVDPKSRMRNPPTYPPEELRRRKGEIVVLEFNREADSPHPVVGQAWVAGQPAGAGDPFVKAARAAVATWVLDPWPAEQLSACVSIEFTLTDPKRVPGAPPADTAPCTSQYVEGFVLPKLLTNPATASF